MGINFHVNFDFGKPRFHVPATSRKRECRNVIHEYHVIAIKVV